MNCVKINYGPKIDFRFCNGCGKCYEYCPADIFGWDENTKMPVVLYPGECSICCYCEIICPEVAIDVEIPLHHLLDFGISPLTIKKLSSTFEKKFNTGINAIF